VNRLNRVDGTLSILTTTTSHYLHQRRRGAKIEHAGGGVGSSRSTGLVINRRQRITKLEDARLRLRLNSVSVWDSDSDSDPFGSLSCSFSRFVHLVHFHYFFVFI